MIKINKIKWLRFASALLLLSYIIPVKKHECAEKQTLIVLTFDDGYSCWLSTVMPILARYGLPATAFINDPDCVHDKTSPEITWNDIRELHHAGWEIGWHTAEHIKVTAANLSELSEDFRHSQDLFKAHGLPSPVTFAYPRGRHDCASMAAASRFFLAARAIHAGVNPPHYVQKHSADLVAINLGNAFPFTNAKEVVDKWRNRGVLIIFAAHTVEQIADWQSQPDMNAKEFQQFAEFLSDGRKKGDFNVVTLKEGVRLMTQRQVTSSWSIGPFSHIDWHLTHHGFAVPQRCFDWYQTINRFRQHHWPKG
ncbi:MAG TPA: polysaccharide deacetylase family protein [Dehalococcoidia bacterium]